MMKINYIASIAVVALAAACNSPENETETAENDPVVEETVEDEGVIGDIKDAGKDVGEAVEGAAEDVGDAVKGDTPEEEAAEDAAEAKADAKEEAEEQAEDEAEGDN